MKLLYLLVSLAILRDSTCEKNFRNTPFLIIDQEGCCNSLHSLDSNPLHRMDRIALTDIIQHLKTQSKIVIIFVEETFSVEDISAKDVLGTSYKHLSRGFKEKRVKYFPSVLDSYLLLTQKFPIHGSTIMHLTNEPMLPDERIKYFYVFFVDGANETRIQALRRHDTLIKDLYYALREKNTGCVTGIYTGKINHILRDSTPFEPVPSTPKDEEEPSMRVESEGALFSFTGLSFVSPLRTARLVQDPLIGEETWSKRKMVRTLSTKMSYTDFELQFDFSFNVGGWKLEKVVLLEGGEQVGETIMGVGAPWGCSYVCSDPLIINNNRDKSSIVIESYKMQAFQKIPVEIEIVGEGDDAEINIKIGDDVSNVDTDSTDIIINGPDVLINGTNIVLLNRTSCCINKDKEFGEPVHCTPYFSSSILVGILVALLCISALSCGVIAMFECKSNDRYGDSREKLLYPRD